MVTELPRILIARKDLPVNNLQELIAYMKANQDKMQYSSAGVGSGTHLPCALLNFTLGVDITHVPYRGEGPALQDVIAGRIDYMCTTIQSGAAQAKQGTVKGIAVMSPRRARDHSRSRHHRRAGSAGRRGDGLERLLLPEGHAEADRRQDAQGDRDDDRASPTSARRWNRSGWKSCRRSSARTAYLAKFLPEDVERWGKVIKAAGISVD